MKRRDFLKVAATGALSVASSIAPNVRLLANEEPVATPKPRWYKGNFHAHSQWSDGKDLPEIVVDAYKTRGYDFFALTDHNIFQKENLRFDGYAMDYTPSDLTPFKGETSFWKKMSPQDGWPNLTEEHLQRARDRFGVDSIVTKKTPEGTYVRMKTFKELKEQFAEKDKFLLIPGFEMTHWVHVNLINVEESFFKEGGLVSAYDAAMDFYKDATNPYIFTVNHPLWLHYDLQPSSLNSRPNIRFLELTNNSTAWDLKPEAWTPESFWDVANAYRASRDLPTIYATGTEDCHGVFQEDYRAFFAWTRVRANELNTNALIDALNKGVSYVSTGLELADVRFDGKTLEIKLDPQVEGEYRIEFIGTKKDYNGEFKLLDAPSVNGSPARKIECYSKEIGKTLETVDGLEGSYTLKADDLYVRAKAYRVGAGLSDHGSKAGHWLDEADCAWTQPYRQGDAL